MPRKAATHIDGVLPHQADRSVPMLFVVDDDLPILELLCEVAEESGWVALRFTSLREVRPMLAEHRPALLILDDDLPDGKGGDLARDLRADPRMADLPLLVCTGAPPLRQAEIGGWAPVVSKPFGIGEIKAFLGAVRLRAEGDPYRQAAR